MLQKKTGSWYIFHNMQRNNALCCEVIVFMMIRLLIRDHFQFTVRLYPDGPYQMFSLHHWCNALTKRKKKSNSSMLNFILYFAMKLTNHYEALKQPAMSMGLFRVDAMTCGYLVLSGGIQADRHAQWLIYYKPNYSNSPVQVEISNNFRRLVVFRFRSINNSARPHA